MTVLITLDYLYPWFYRQSINNSTMLLLPKCYLSFRGNTALTGLSGAAQPCPQQLPISHADGHLVAAMLLTAPLVPVHGGKRSQEG